MCMKENVPENLEIQVRNSSQSLGTPNQFTLEYANPQKQKLFYSNYENTLHNKLPNEVKKCEQYSTAANQLRKYFKENEFDRKTLQKIINNFQKKTCTINNNGKSIESPVGKVKKKN